MQKTYLCTQNSNPTNIMNWYIKCLKQYADFSGRARRKEYWMFTLFNVLIQLVLWMIDVAIGTPLILGWIYSLAVFIPGIAVCVRRLHDVGRSGWFYLLNFIPFVGAIFLLVLLCDEGQRMSNKWGEDPKQNERL